MEVSTDAGQTWRDAQLQEPVLSKALTRFRAPWQWDGGPAMLQSRATDETGYLQPKHNELVEVRGVNSFYHYNAVQTWRVSPTGALTAYVA